MTEPLHTPGPWSAEDSEIFSAEAWRIAETCPLRGDADPSGVSPAERANARLIAAAPELLTALKDLDAVLEGTPMPDCAAMNRLIKASSRARAVIARAEGLADRKDPQ